MSIDYTMCNKSIHKSHLNIQLFTFAGIKNTHTAKTCDQISVRDFEGIDRQTITKITQHIILFKKLLLLTDMTALQ